MNSHCTITVIKMPTKISLTVTILQFEGSLGTLVRDKSQAAEEDCLSLSTQRMFTTLMTLTYPIPDISMLRQPGGF